MSRLRTISEWIVLLPLWRRLFKSTGWRAAAAGGTGLFWLLIIAAVAAGGSGDEKKNEATRADEARTASPRATTRMATNVPVTVAPTPPPTPAPTPVPTPNLAPIEISGVGQFATEAVTPTCPICRARITHTGSGYFGVKSFQGTTEDLLVNTAGAYQGDRPIFGEAPIVFDIDADGAWVILIEWVRFGAQPPFSGRGDAMSDFFDPPTSGAWQFTHDGQGYFGVWLRCAGGEDLVQNEAGPVSGSGIVSFDEGPCLWEVQADGNWSLAPR